MQRNNWNDRQAICLTGQDVAQFSATRPQASLSPGYANEKNFIINLCLDKREQNYVDYSKQIVVHLSSTPAGLKVVEFLLLQINPRSMVSEKREPMPPPPDAVNLPYLADLTQVLPSSNKQVSIT